MIKLKDINNSVLKCDYTVETNQNGGQNSIYSASIAVIYMYIYIYFGVIKYGRIQHGILAVINYNKNGIHLINKLIY